MKTLKAVPFYRDEHDRNRAYDIGVANVHELNAQMVECLENNEPFTLDLGAINNPGYTNLFENQGRMFCPFRCRETNDIWNGRPKKIWVESATNPWSERPTEPEWILIRDAEKLQRLMTIKGTSKEYRREIEGFFENSKKTMGMNEVAIQDCKETQTELDLIIKTIGNDKDRPMEILEFIMATHKTNERKKMLDQIRKHYGVPSPAQRERLRQKEEKAKAKASEPKKKAVKKTKELVS